MEYIQKNRVGRSFSGTNMKFRCVSFIMYQRSLHKHLFEKGKGVMPLIIKRSLGLLICLFGAFFVINAQESCVSGTIKVFPWVEAPVVLSTDMLGGFQSLGSITLSGSPSVELNVAVPEYKRLNGMVVSVTNTAGKTRYFEYSNGTTSWHEIYVVLNWESGCSYAVGDFVAYLGNFYVANTGHTSSTVFGDDVAKWNNAGGKDGKYTASNLVTTSFKLTNGASNGYVLKTDGTGNATWNSPNTYYKGTWDALSNNPRLADGTGSPGDFYLVSVSGTLSSRNFTSGGQAVYNGSIWEPVANANTISSVNGRTGTVQINPSLSENTLSLIGGTATVDLSTAKVITDLQGNLKKNVPYSGATGNVDLGGSGLSAKTLRITNGAQSGYVLKSDASGNATWNSSNTYYKGTWDASLNNPSLSDGIGSRGDYYIVSVSGNTFLRNFTVGGQAVYNGSIWEPVANSNAVFSVNAFTGAVQINPFLVGNTLSLSGGTTTVDLSASTAIAALQDQFADIKSISGIVKSNGVTVSAATAGIDYLAPTGSAASLTNFPTLNQSTTGNAATATKLATSRTINGVSFDGTENITISASGSTVTVTVGGDLTAADDGKLTINSGVVTSAKITDGTIMDADVSSSAAILGAKISPDFGAQEVKGTKFTATSDRRLKQKIETLTNVLERINHLRGVSFEFIDQHKYAAGPQVGLIAQELQAVYPELVSTNNEGYFQVNYSQLTAVVLQGMKELLARFDLMQQKVQEQEIRQNQLQEQVSSQQKEIEQIKNSLLEMKGQK